MGYDNERVYGECEDRDSRPIIPLRETVAVKGGAHKPPTCEHGEWRFAGADARRGEAKWRCPTGACHPQSRWVKADRLHPLIPRESKRWKTLYRGRAAVEREFGRLKNEWALLPLRVRGIERVRLHARVAILSRTGRKAICTVEWTGAEREGRGPEPDPFPWPLRSVRVLARNG